MPAQAIAQTWTFAGRRTHAAMVLLCAEWGPLRPQRQGQKCGFAGAEVAEAGNWNRRPLLCDSRVALHHGLDVNLGFWQNDVTEF